MLASKGNDDSSMWQKVTRGLDKIISITKYINATLKIHDEDGERSINIDKEIFNWRALLRKSKYLKSHRNTEYVFNNYGKRLNNDLISFSSNLKACMDSYWEERKLRNKPVIEFLNVQPGFEMTHMLYYEKEI